MYRKKFIDKLRTKYQNGGTPKFTGQLPPNMPNYVQPLQGVIKPQDTSIRNKMWQAANKMTNFTMSPDGKPGLPSQLLAEFTGLPSLGRIPTSATKAYKDPSASNLFHVATDAAGVIGGGLLAKGAAKGFQGLGKGALALDELAAVANTSRTAKLAHGTHATLENAHQAEVTYNNIANAKRSSNIPIIAANKNKVIPPLSFNTIPSAVESTRSPMINIPTILQKGGMYNEPGELQNTRIRKFHEGGAADQDHMNMMNMGTQEDHFTSEHGNTGGDEGSGYNYFDSSTWEGGNPDNTPKIDFGLSWGNQGQGFGPIISGKGAKQLGDWGKGVWDKSSGWGKAGIVASGIGAPLALAGTSLGGKAIKGIKNLFGWRDGGVRHQTGGMYDQMRQYQQGGMHLPGGQMQPIPGSDAVQFNGASHNQGGIMLDPQTEVEGGETMDQVNMAKKGGKRDYFFSSHLKEGGRSYADMHKEILENGGSQEEINMLAKMQEVAAGRNPKQVAKLGGVVKYEEGGEKEIYTIAGGKEYTRKEYFEAIKNKTISKEEILEGGKNRTEILNEQSREKKKEEGHKQMLDKGFIYDETSKTYKKPSKEVTSPPKSNAKTSKSPFKSKAKEEAFQDWANKSVDEGGGGYDTKGRGWGPASQAAYDQSFADYEATITEAISSDDAVNAAVEVIETDAEQKVREQQERKEARRRPEAERHQKVYDNVQLFIDQGRTLTDQQQADYDAATAFLGDDRQTTAQRKESQSLLDEMKDKAARQGNVPGLAYAAGAAQLAPAVYSMFHKQPDAEQSVYTPGFTKPIIAERGKASDLERVNYNAERSTNAAEMRGINEFIETSGGGPANIINKMSAYARKQAGDMKITAAETRANIDISNREAQLNQAMELSNMQRAQQASMTNAQLSRAETARMDQIGQLNAAARQKVKDDQEAMKYQGWGLAAQGIAGIAGDVMSYKGQERLAQNIGTEGIYQRDQLRSLIKKQYPDWDDNQINTFMTQNNTTA